jgi:hypothetical protein
MGSTDSIAAPSKSYDEGMALRGRWLRYAVSIGFLLVLGWLSGAVYLLPRYGIPVSFYHQILNVAAFLLLATSFWTRFSPAVGVQGTGSGSSSEHRSLVMTTTAFLGFLAAVLAVHWRVILPLHEDVAYITQETYRLIQEGSLRSAGFVFPYQALRPESHSTSPFFAQYLLAVFYYWPFIKMLGTNDAAFFVGQSILLLVLASAVARSGLGWRWAVLTVALGILSRTILESFYASPSQLLALCLVAYFWLRFQGAITPRPALDGLLFGLSLYTRPEAAFIAVLSMGLWFLRTVDGPTRWRLAWRTVASFAITVLLLGVVRKLLGAASAADNRLELLMSDVLAPGFDVLELPHISPLSSVLRDPILLGRLVRKVVGGFTHALLPWSSWGRRDHLLVLLPLFLALARVSRLRDYVPLYLFFLFQALLNAMLLPMPRHSDAVFFLFLWNLALDMKRWLEAHTVVFHRVMQNGMLVVLGAACAVSLPDVRENTRQALTLRSLQLAASNEAHRLVPHDAFVITDRLELWLWYGRGEKCCFIPMHNPETMRLLLAKYPGAYVVLFCGNNRTGYPMEPFGRPLLSATRYATIYGPAL